MATYTDNYQLTKPTYAEQADIGVINSNMNIIDDVMHSSQISLAPAYDQSQTYAEGDVVMYELLMYKCISPTTGVWDGSKWERTTASESGGGGSAELDILGEGNGAVVSFADGASAELAKCIADINPVQDLHGYDKPWAGGAGKNKLLITATTSSSKGLEFTVNSDGSVKIYGTTTENNVFFNLNYASGIKRVTEGIDYKILLLTDDSNVNLQIVKDISPVVIATNNSTPSNPNPTTFNIPLNTGTANWLRIQVANAGVHVDTTVYPMLLESSTTDYTFEPYSNICPISGSTSVTVTVSDGETSTTKTTPLGQTVYGGQLNVLTGELTIDRQIVDLGSLTWTRTDNSIIDVGYWFHANISGKMATGETINSNYRTAPYKSVAQLVNAEGSAVDKVAVEAGGEVGYRIIDSSYTDATAFKTAMNGVQMCYFLATPQTVQLTPQEVNSLLGQNNISADTGDVDIVYVKASAPIQPNPTGTPTATLKKLGIEGTVFEVPSGGGGSSGINYSTTEQVIGTWVDRKPLYQRIIIINNETFNASGLYDLNVTPIIPDVSNLFSDSIHSFYEFSNYKRQFERLVPEDGHILAYGTANRQIEIGYITIQYTKITD